ncbi:MAG: Cdc6/Cdc18 family protein [Promethearchaeia archaeon]
MKYDDKFDIDKFYKKYLKGPKMFKNRDALDPSYVPEELPHRDNEIQAIAEKTACALMGDTPQSFLCHGRTGTGKTATVRYVSQKLEEHCTSSGKNKPWWIYINCNIVSTPYRILAHIFNTIVKEEQIPPTGLPKDVIFKKLLGLLDEKIKICFLVLDEVDILMEKSGGDEILYDLTRINENLDSCRCSLIGISNVLNLTESLDPRVKSSLGNEEPVVFNPYNANQLSVILEKRATVAFQDGVINPGVIKLCAGLAAQENGDARKALQLLRKAGELAERAQNKKITDKHIIDAQTNLEEGHIIEYIKGLPLQAQIILTAIYLIIKNEPKIMIKSGDIYEVHSELCNQIPGVSGLTKRQKSNYITELDTAGIISTTLRSLGYYGRTKIIELDIDLELLERILNQIEKVKDLLEYKPILLQSDKVKIKNNTFRKLL